MWKEEYEGICSPSAYLFSTALFSCRDSPEIADVTDNRSHDVAIYYPRINYVSLLGVDGGDDANVLADEIALKYLTSNQMQNVQYQVKQRTKSVKFEGLLDRPVLQTPKVSMNFVSMNVSCNMSVPTKHYLQKYDLLEGEVRRPPAQRNTQPSFKKASSRRGLVLADEKEGKENDQGNVLDLMKLKGLPKLM